MARHLPGRARILDAGGGPGRYAIALAKMGHEVTLFDLTPALLDIARREAAKAGLLERIAIHQGTITDLSRYEDDSFDVTLCLGGPLSHLREVDERAQAMTELARVTRSGGIVATSVMGLIAVMAETVRYWPGEIADKEPERFRNFYLNGDDERFVGRSYCHFYRPEEFTALVAGAELEILECVGLEGLGTAFWDEVAALAESIRPSMPCGWSNTITMSPIRWCLGPATTCWWWRANHRFTLCWLEGSR